MSCPETALPKISLQKEIDMHVMCSVSLPHLLICVNSSAVIVGLHPAAIPATQYSSIFTAGCKPTSNAEL